MENKKMTRKEMIIALLDCYVEKADPVELITAYKEKYERIFNSRTTSDLKQIFKDTFPDGY